MSRISERLYHSKMFKKDRIEITMPYIGKRLSVNHYKPDGRHTCYETLEWMGILASIARMELNKLVQVKVPVVIHLTGKFKDHRSTPDLHNLHKCIGDSLKSVDSIPDDKEFLFRDEGYSIDKAHDPELIISIEVEVKHG